MSWQDIIKEDKFKTVHIPYVLKKLGKKQPLRELRDYVKDYLDVASKNGWTLYIESKEVGDSKSKHKDSDSLLAELEFMNKGHEGTMDLKVHVEPIGNDLYESNDFLFR